ncbi:tRNA (guanosine(46)-N7)-methyltransferase TrmB [Tuberibacillus calidus]|jgi:tRNA (guanine-N7-)-methyltransferase|uniref:tRNA (guanosine(46)-N7)-methyltransferase TrmB n=1 Tax=Tuberibacillus calidus TaxID=340097 RepID=UPI00040712D5|nr:tRNA (guanosine(46)-N7)-methyltransferase TrmB [Tuberibacillus calidus]
MRVRHKPWAADYITQHTDIVLQQPEQYKGSWHTVFGNRHPLNIEIGTGKGQFITGMGKLFPEENFIGIEREKSVIVSAVQKLVDHPLDNVKLLNVNAQNLMDYFADAEIDRIYLNFSDPWPKKRHEKRRLTYRDFLETYKRVLKPGGRICLKTDNQAFFEYSLESFSKFGMILENISLDLHQAKIEHNVQTEYEEKFAAKGHRIYRCEAFFKNGN